MFTPLYSKISSPINRKPVGRSPCLVRCFFSQPETSICRGFPSHVSLPNQRIISIYIYINPTIVGYISIKIQIDPIKKKKHQINHQPGSL